MSAEVWISVFVLVTVSIAETTDARQYFVRQPANTTVRLGDTALIRCAVGNLQTSMQWTKDGFGLGRSRFPNPRYSISGNRQIGEYNLQIRDVQLSDDGVFHCQALPDHTRNINDLNSRRAFLTVLVPPKNVILDPSVSGVISVRYPGTVRISCSTPYTKPESEISWRVGGMVYGGQVNENFESEPRSKLITASSYIELNPDKQNNGSVIECIIRHPAMDASFSSLAVLNVLYPPNPPSITDYNGQPIKSGEILTMKCVVHGGNPLAKITWLIDDLIVNQDYTHTKDTAKSVLHHKVRPEDHGKVVKCRAESPALDIPLVAQVALEVYYPPAKLFLEQDPEDGAQAQESLSFICRYEHSNPRATLKWYIDNVELPSQWNYNVISTPYVISTVKSDTTSFRTNLTLTSLRREDANKEIKCLASLPIIGYEGEVSAYPTINHPPYDIDISIFYLNTPITVPAISHGTVDPPVRSLSPGSDSVNGGLGDNTAFRAGDTIQLRCQAKGGNPPPQLRWMQGGVPIIPGPKTTILSPEISTEIKMSSEGREIKEFVTSITLELTLDPEYNGRFITCEAGHELYSDTLEAREKLKVVFPPASLEIDQFPTHPVAGHSMSLTCTTSSSNPPSKISWYLQGKKLPEQWSVELPPSRGINQGFVLSSRLRMIPEVGEDGSDIVCSAEVEVLQRTIKQPIKLSVRYPPVFTRIKKNNSINVTEDALGVDIDAVAHGNPSNITYSWYRIVKDADDTNLQETDKVPLLMDTDRVVWSTINGNLRINDLRKSDNGVYIVRATNERGTTEMNVTLNVFYSPLIMKISGPEYALKEGDTTTLQCDFDSHKLTPARVNWIKLLPGAGRKYYEVSTHSDHSVLTLRNLTAKDRGNYKCVVDNGIGQSESEVFSLELLYAPVFPSSSPRKIAVSSVASDGTLSPPAVLPCTATGNPLANYKWMMGNKTISKSGELGYSFLSDVLNFETNRNSLRITTIHNKQIEKDGTVAEFTCIAYNSAGESEWNIKIVLRGPPDSPTDLRIFNTTDQSLDISWRPAFNGGSEQTFLLRIKQQGTQIYKEIKTNLNHVTVSRLKASHIYEVEVIARNVHGKSDPTTPVQTRTADSPTNETERLHKAAFLSLKFIILIATIGGLILILLVVLPLLLHKRCQSSSYKPGAIKNDAENSKQAESTLSSHLSASQRESLELNEMEKLSDATSSGRQSDRCCRGFECCQGSDKNTLTTELGFLPQSNCFDYSLSRCGSSTTTEPCEDGRRKSAACSCSAFQDDIPDMPSYSQINRFHELNRSNRNGKPFSQQLATRDSSQEPRFRCDVRPSPTCDSFSNSCVAYSNDLYERKGFMPRPDNLPLPPALPLFNHLQYPTQQTTMLMSSEPNGTGSLGFTRSQGFGMRSSFRPYYTLDAGPYKPNLERFPSDDGYQNPNTTDRFQNRYEGYREVQHQSERMSPQESISSNPGDRCLYNVVSIPSYQSYTDSHCSRSSPLYVKSIDNIDDPHQQKQSIINEDGSINTYGYDEPTESEAKFSKSSVMCSIRESQSQDPLPFCSQPSFSNNNNQSTDTSTRMPAVETQSYFNFGRRSLRGVPSTAAEKVSSIRDLTPPICFRDELHLALSNTTRQPLLSNEEQRTSRSSDDDKDSGCGGSNDAVPVGVASPVVESFKPIVESQKDKEDMEGTLFV